MTGPNGVLARLPDRGWWYGPQAALIAESFDSNVRYSGAGIGYHLASVIAGGPAPLIATAILQHTGSSTWISLYIVGCAVVSLIALLLMPRARVEKDTDTRPGRSPRRSSSGGVNEHVAVLR